MKTEYSMDESADTLTFKSDKTHSISVEESCYEKRLKVFYTICIYATFFSMGAVYAQVGPSLMDLQMITNVGLEKGSWIPTAMFIGLVVGTIGNGAIFHRVKIAWVFFILTIVFFLVIASIPWSSVFGVTVLLYVVAGIVHGILQAAGFAEVVIQWRTHSRVMVIILTLTYYVGSIISPLYTAPFLKINLWTTPEPSDLNLTNWLNTARTFHKLNQSESNISSSRSRTNDYMLYVPYSITATMILLGGLCFALYLIFKTCYSSKSDYMYQQKLPIASNEIDIPLRQNKLLLTKRIKIGGITSLVAIMAIANTVANVYLSYISTFCVEYLHWSKQNGSYMSALCYIFIVIGALVGIPLSKCLEKPLHLGIQTAAMLISFVFLIISVQTANTVSTWITSGLFGFGYSATNSLVFSWMDDTFANMQGKISSLFFLTATAVTAVNLQLTASLMDRFSQIYFCYVLLIETSLIPVFCILVTFLTFRHNKNCELTNMVNNNKML